MRNFPTHASMENRHENEFDDYMEVRNFIYLLSYMRYYCFKSICQSDILFSNFNLPQVFWWIGLENLLLWIIKNVLLPGKVLFKNLTLLIIESSSKISTFPRNTNKKATSLLFAGVQILSFLYKCELYFPILNRLIFKINLLTQNHASLCGFFANTKTFCDDLLYLESRESQLFLVFFFNIKFWMESFCLLMFFFK